MFVGAFVVEAGLVLCGCILAHQSRFVASEFSESRQLIIAMYSIALVGTIILIVVNVADMDRNGHSILKAIGVFWGTVVSTAVFVVPRMIQVKNDPCMMSDARVSGIVKSECSGSYQFSAGSGNSSRTLGPIAEHSDHPATKHDSQLSMSKEEDSEADPSGHREVTIDPAHEDKAASTV